MNTKKETPNIENTLLKKRLSIRFKITALALGIGIVPIVIVGLIGYQNARNAIEQEAFDKLISIRELKKQQVEDYFIGLRQHTRHMASMLVVQRSMQEFKNAFKMMKKKEVPLSLMKEYRAKLQTYYKDTFDKEYTRKHSGHSINEQFSALEIFEKLSNTTIALQYFYIQSNPYPPENKHLFNYHDAPFIYNQIHKKYHRTLSRAFSIIDHYDIFLIDHKTGNIIYTTFKEIDFATSLMFGPYTNSHLGKLFKEINKSSNPEIVRMIDFQSFSPSLERAASFIGTPIFSDGKKVGVLIIQISIKKLNDILTSHQRWKETGLGKTGEVLLVGDDLTLRNDSRFLIEDRDNYLDNLIKAGIEKEITDHVREENSSILLQKIDTKGTQAAFAGRTGTEIFLDYRKIPVLSAYSPLNIPDVNWVIMSEIDRNEAFSLAINFRQFVFWVIIISLILIAIIAGLWSRILTRPIGHIMKATMALGTGQYNIKVPITSKDEFGVLANHFNLMAQQITDQQNLLEQEKTALAEQNQLETGINSIYKAVTGNLDFKAFANKIMHTITPYINAQIGVFYQWNDEKKYLELIGKYAYSSSNKSISINQTFKLQEGIIGQVAFEQKTIHLEDVPKDFFNQINSALGSKSPNSIFCFPLIFENQLLGVIELGSWQKFDGWKTKFIESAKMVIATALKMIESRIKTEQLLEESQLLTEELQKTTEEQEETNEQLEEQTQNLHKTQIELKTRNIALEQSQKELEERSEQLVLTNKYKSEFLANMSHELRTPLNSIILLSKLLFNGQAGKMNAKQIKHATIINDAGKDLLHLINEILDLSKIEAGKTTINRSTFPIRELITAQERSFTEIANEKGLSFITQVDSKVPSTLISDREKLQQIIRNFLSNAFKFTQKGSVTLQVEMQLPLERNEIAFKVTDTGIGIPKDQQQYIFEAFKQLDSSSDRKYSGTGLGLSICNNIAIWLGGRITVQSEVIKGSIFSIVLPIKPSNELKNKTGPLAKTTIDEVKSTSKIISSITDDQAIIKKGDKVLLIVVEDNEVMIDLLETGRKWGYRVLTAQSSSMTLDWAQKYYPRAIIIDAQLSIGNGWEILQQLKANYRTRRIPVTIISDIEESEFYYRMGAFNFQLKPITLKLSEHLFKKLDSFVQKEKFDLMIVSSDTKERTQLKKLIVARDLKIHEVSTGTQALEKMITEDFDCVIINWDTSDLDRTLFIDAIKKQVLPIKQIPLIIYSAQALSNDDEKFLRAITSTIIVKGDYSPTRLIEEVGKNLCYSPINLEKKELISEIIFSEDVFKGKTVLLVDDDIRNIYALTSILESKEINVLTAGNGEEAIEILQSSKEISLILMDIMMPKMDGYKAIGKIRDIPKYKNLPIVALTAKAMKQDRQHAMDAGASDYLTKPVDFKRLLLLIRIWLNAKL